MSEPNRDVFPATMRTWIHQQLDLGDPGRAALNRYVMEIYFEPLRVYYQGTGARWLGDSEEIVAGFFADRLARTAFLQQWQATAMPLRRWLMNAMCLYIKEQTRQRRRLAKFVVLPEESIPSPQSSVPEQDVDRAYLVAVAKLALKRAQEECAREGFEPHWNAFVLRHFDELSFDEIGRALSAKAERVRVMIRTVKERVRKHVRECLARDGASPENVDREIRSLLDTVN